MLRDDQGNVSPHLTDTLSVVPDTHSDSCAMFPQKRKVGAAADQPHPLHVKQAKLYARTIAFQLGHALRLYFS
jgi:hypothetical protein